MGLFRPVHELLLLLVHRDAVAQAFNECEFTLQFFAEGAADRMPDAEQQFTLFVLEQLGHQCPFLFGQDRRRVRGLHHSGLLSVLLPPHYSEIAPEGRGIGGGAVLRREDFAGGALARFDGAVHESLPFARRVLSAEMRVALALAFRAAELCVLTRPVE